jgi:hypothetical protein
MLILVSSCVLVLGLGTGAVALQRQAPPPPNPLASIPTFRCSFPKHVATEWVNGQPVTVAGEEQFTFQITNINLRRGNARLVGAGGGTADVTAMLSGTGLNVIEQTGLGNFILTTIFTTGGADRVYPAAHSRHLGDVSALPSVSQHFGTCEAAK